MSSWVIREKATRRVICETFNPVVAQTINTDKYEAVPILPYLQSLNATTDHDALEFNPDPETVETIRTHLWLQRNAREMANPEGVDA